MDDFSPLLTEPLLRKEDEVSLAGVIDKAAQLSASLGSDEPSRAQQRVLSAGVVAKERFIKANLRLVLKIANGYRLPLGVSREDVFQEGVIGLNRAVDKFDASRGFKFSTYATNWIRQAIGRMLEANATPVTIARDRVSAVSQARRAGLELTDAQVVWAKAINPSRTVLVADGQQLPLVETLQAVCDVEADCETSQTAQGVRAAVEALEAGDRYYVKGRFGMGREPMTYTALGAEMGVCPEEARRRTKAALRKLGRVLEPLVAA